MSDLEERLRIYQSKLMAAEDRIEVLEAALHKIVQWSEAYPLDIFPEPDWKKAAALLKTGGITLDSISAHTMRHVVEGVGQLARAGLAPEDAA